MTTLGILKLPQYKFDGRVIVLNSIEEEERIAGIFDTCEVLGYDTEAQPQSSCSIARNATSLVQIASENVAVIWRLGQDAKTDGSGWHRQALPPYLKKLVNNSDVTKVSQGAVHEVRMPAIQMNEFAKFLLLFALAAQDFSRTFQQSIHAGILLAMAFRSTPRWPH